ncbi:RnfABCDGE type electron transport complex subunit B [bacterium]|nr:RnfABCDGE type electron transport complex subunit B [bacterium]
MHYAIIGALIELGFFGLLFGIGLAIAAKKFAIEIDPRVEKVLDILPNANCGACGYPGCSGFAKGVVAGEAPVDGCVPGGGDVAENIANILGKSVGETAEPMVAVAKCNGGNNANDKFIYEGIADCRAAKVVAGGQKLCPYGCLGFGTCVEVCPFDALTMSENNIPITDFDKCTGCGICVKICPNDVMALVPKNAPIYVACNSISKGAFVRKSCKSGCIGCMMCQKNCPSDAIHIIDNLARIDFDKCTACGICIEVCPTNTILNKFEEILAQNNGVPTAVPINPDETKALLAKIKDEQKKKKEAAKAEALKKAKPQSEPKGENRA